MSLNKLIIIFGIILVIFAGIVFFQFSAKSNDKKPSSGPSVTAGGQTFKVEVAKTPKDQEMGLSGRGSLDQDKGMLFLFEKPDYYNFWMKNMKFPIDIIFIKNDKIISIAKNAKPPKSPNDNPQIFKPTGLIDKVLEINEGLSDKYNIKKGDTVKINL